MIWKNIVLLAVPKGDPTEIRAGPQLYRIGVRRVRVPSSVESVKRSAPQRLPYVFAGAVLHDVIDALTVRGEVDVPRVVRCFSDFDGGSAPVDGLPPKR